MTSSYCVILLLFDAIIVFFIIMLFPTFNLNYLSFIIIVFISCQAPSYNVLLHKHRIFNKFGVNAHNKQQFLQKGLLILSQLVALYNKANEIEFVVT